MSDPAGVQGLRELSAKWRDEADASTSSFMLNKSVQRRCADELDAALAAAPPPHGVEAQALNRAEIERAVKDVRAADTLDAAVDLAVMLLVKRGSVPPPQAVGAPGWQPGPFDGELTVLRKGQFVCGINAPYIDSVLDAISDVLQIDIRAEGHEG